MKGFNTVFRHVLENGRPDIFIASDNAQARAGVEAFVKSLGVRPMDAGGLQMAHWLEGAGLLTMGLARHGAGAGNSPSVSRNLPPDSVSN